MTSLIICLILASADPTLYANAAECYRMQDYRAAHDLSIDYLKDDPNDIPAQFLYVASCNQLGIMDEARGLYIKAEARDDVNAKGFLSLIELVKGEEVKASSDARTWLEKHPDCAPALFVSALRGSTDEEQLEAAEKLTPLVPNLAEGHELHASLLQAAGKRDAACMEMRIAYGLPGRSARAAGALAELLMLSNNGEEAWKICNDSIQNGESDIRCWSVATAILNARHKDQEMMFMLYQAVLRGQPDRYIKTITDGLLAKSLKHDHEHHNGAEAEYETAMQLYQSGKVDEAYSRLDKLSKSDPEDALIWAMRGISLSDLGRHDEAIQSLEKASTLSPSNPRIELYYGEIYRKTNDYAKAFQHFSNSVWLDPTDTRGFAGMASSALLAGSDGPETFYALAALNLQPSNADAATVLEMKRSYVSGKPAFSLSINGLNIIGYRFLAAGDSPVVRRYEAVVLDETGAWRRSYCWVVIPQGEFLEIRDGESKDHRLLPMSLNATILDSIKLIRLDLIENPVK